IYFARADEQRHSARAAMSGAGLSSRRAGSSTIAARLAEAKQRYESQNPKSRERWHFAATSMPGGNTRTVLFFDPFPLCMAHGEDCLLFDVDGHRYFDMLGEYTAGIFGHSHPIIRQAVMTALDSGIALSAHNQAEGELAAAIRSRFSSMELL